MAAAAAAPKIYHSSPTTTPIPPRTECRTSEGLRVRVSLRCAAPPSSSYLYYDTSRRGSTILTTTSASESPRLVYRPPPAGGARPPSLSPPLPVPDFPTTTKSGRVLTRLRSSWGIGLLRRGENDDDVLVVHVGLQYDCDVRLQMAVFCVLRPGERRWELMQPAVPIAEYSLPSTPCCVICVGDRFLCLVTYGSHLWLCDMADNAAASPKVRYVHPPPEVSRCSYGDDDTLRVRRMGAAGGSAMRLVSIHPYCCGAAAYTRDDPDRCCCEDGGGAAACSWHPRFVFTVKTWTMKLGMEEPLEWVEDGEMDGEEIWALPGYEGLPQAIPEWPVVCLGEPNVVCFTVSNYHFTKDAHKVWMVQLNIHTKTILSVVEITDHGDYCWWDRHHLPAEIQY